MIANWIFETERGDTAIKKVQFSWEQVPDKSVRRHITQQ